MSERRCETCNGSLVAGGACDRAMRSDKRFCSLRCRSQWRTLVMARGEMPTDLHGTATGYAHWGCRCDPCKQAGVERNRVGNARQTARLRDIRERRANVARGVGP